MLTSSLATTDGKRLVMCRASRAIGASIGAWMSVIAASFLHVRLAGGGRGTDLAGEHGQHDDHEHVREDVDELRRDVDDLVELELRRHRRGEGEEQRAV